MLGTVRTVTIYFDQLGCGASNSGIQSKLDLILNGNIQRNVCIFEMAYSKVWIIYFFSISGPFWTGFDQFSKAKDDSETDKNITSLWGCTKAKLF